MRLCTIRLNSSIATGYFCALLAAAIILQPTCSRAAPKSADSAAATKESAPAEYQAAPHSVELNERGVGAVKARDYKDAEELFRQALAADRRNLTAVVNLAAMYMTQKKSSAAVELLQEFSKEYPAEPSLHARLGDALFSLKDVNGARASYEKALSLDTKFPGISARLATIYTLSNKLNDAERLFLEAVDQNPKDTQSLASLSSILLVNQKPDMAIRMAKRALQLSPTKEIYVTLGSAYEMKKEFKSAQIAFQRAIDLGDTSPEVKEKMVALNRIAGS